MKLFRVFKSQRGEITAMLAIAAIVVIGIGVVLGISSIQEGQSRLASAQLLPGPYPYHSRAEIRDENGNVILWTPGLTWSNQITGPLDPPSSSGDVKDATCTTDCPATLSWNTGDVPVNMRDTVIDVTFRMPPGYTIIEPYCESNPRDLCENTSVESDGTTYSTRKGLRIEKNAQLVYGLVVRTAAGIPEDPDPDPENPDPGDPGPNPDPDPNPGPGDPNPDPDPEDPGDNQCPYSALAHVYQNERGTELSVSELAGNPMRATNHRGDGQDLNEGGLSKARYFSHNIKFDRTGRSAPRENEAATVTLSNYDTNIWNIKSVFCEGATGSVRGCPTAADIDRMNSAISNGTSTGAAIDGFRINCNVNIDYGWIVERAGTGGPGEPDPDPDPDPGNPDPGKPNPKEPDPGPGEGNLVVRVEAANFPQKTDIWPRNHAASKDVQVCSHFSDSGAPRPLYYSPFKVTATCQGGGCTVGEEHSVKADKREGKVSFTNLPTGYYALSIDGTDGRGFSVWEGCENVLWVIEPGKTNAFPVIILVNELDKKYEKRNTEKLCKDEDGKPNLVEGLGGKHANVCYLPNDKDQGDYGLPLNVKITNKNANVGRLKVQLEPCPGYWEVCDKEVTFDGRLETQDVLFRPGGHQPYNVRITDITKHQGLSLLKKVFAQENGKVFVESCTGQAVSDGPEDQKCRMFAPGNVHFNVLTKDVDNPGPIPEPRPNPGNVIHSCKYMTEGNCSVDLLETVFGPLRSQDPNIVKKMSAICHEESGGRKSPKPLDLCLNTGRKCFIDKDGDGKRETWSYTDNCVTQDYSWGIFQINLYGVCAEPLVTADQWANRRDTAGTPVCAEDTVGFPNSRACGKQKEDLNFQFSEARKKYESQGLAAWRCSAEKCGFIPKGGCIR